MSESDLPIGTEIVPTADGVDLVAKSPVDPADPLAEFKDDRKYRAKAIGVRTALRRALDRKSKLTAESRGVRPEVQEAIREFDEAYGPGNRRVVDDVALILESLARRDDAKPSEVLAVVRELIDQTDGPVKETIQHDVNMMSIKVVELPPGEAEGL